MKENFKQFVMEISCEDTPLGDLCTDLLRDKDFNWEWTLTEIRKYISELPDRYGSHLEYAASKFLKILDTNYEKVH